MKKVANGGETAVVIPPVLEVVEVKLALVVPIVEIRHVAVAISVRPDRAFMCNISSNPPPLEYTLEVVFYSGTLNPLIYHTKYLHLKNYQKHFYCKP
ncbi:MAG: hypothetical protein AAB351_00725 [Patescibacteria group bacterium]